jgi:pantoate kinase
MGFLMGQSVKAPHHLTALHSPVGRIELTIKGTVYCDALLSRRTSRPLRTVEAVAGVNDNGTTARSTRATALKQRKHESEHDLHGG